MRQRDIVGAGIGSGLIGALVFGIVALLAIQFQLEAPVDYYTVGGVALLGAFLFALVGGAAARRLPPTGRT